MAQMKLKPCPFCGNKEITSEMLGSIGPVNTDPVISLWIVGCYCGGQVVVEGKENAEKQWNKRITEKST